MFSFQKLDVYRCSIELLSKVDELSAAVPKGCGGMGDQLRRAALSIPLNIAEGTGRSGRDAKRFYLIARGSAFECAAIMDALNALQIVDQRACLAHVALLDRIVAMLTAMARA